MKEDKLIEKYYKALKAFSLKQTEEASMIGKKVTELVVYWSEQGPYTTRVRNLMAHAKVDGDYHQLIKEVLVEKDWGSFYVNSVDLKVDFPNKKIRDIATKYPEIKPFFINSYNHEYFYFEEDDFKAIENGEEEKLEEDEEQQEILEKWFESDNESGDMPADDISPLAEFDWMIYCLMDAAIEHLEQDLNKVDVLKKVNFKLTGDDSDRCDAGYIATGLKHRREFLGYQPTEEFIREFLSIFSNNEVFINYFVQVFLNLPDLKYGSYTLAKNSPHPIAIV